MLFSALAHGATPLNSFDTVLGIQRDGSVVIVEKFAPASPQHSILWATSTEYPGTWGIHDPRVVEILQVTTTEGAALKYEVRRSFGKWKYASTRQVPGKSGSVYSVRNAVQFLQDRDELQWSAGEGWRGAPKQQRSLSRCRRNWRGRREFKRMFAGEACCRFVQRRPDPIACGSRQANRSDSTIR